MSSDIEKSLHKKMRPLGLFVALLAIIATLIMFLVLHDYGMGTVDAVIAAWFIWDRKLYKREP